MVRLGVGGWAYFFGWGGWVGGWLEKVKIKLNSTQAVVEVRVELGNIFTTHLQEKFKSKLKIELTLASTSKNNLAESSVSINLILRPTHHSSTYPIKEKFKSQL